MKPPATGMVVHGTTGRAIVKREAALRSALEEISRTIAGGLGPSEWREFGDTAIPLADGGSVSLGAQRGRGFSAVLKDSEGVVAQLSCTIVDAFDHLYDLPARTMAHAAWCIEVLTSPRSSERHAAWMEAATNLAALAAALHEGSTGACTLQPGPSEEPIRLESTGRDGWVVPHSQAVERYVERSCPPYVSVEHGRTGDGASTVRICHGPKTMAFAEEPDAIERLRLMVATGLDPEDLVRVGADG